MAEKKTYVTTDKAGPRVAGRVIPWGEGGKTKVGHPLELTAAEAEYELSLGTIVLKVDAKSEGKSESKARKPADAPAVDGSNGA